MAIVQRRDTITTLKTQLEIFSDFLADFDIHPLKKDVVRNVNEEAVKSSIRNLLMTNRGDRLYNSTIGSDIRAILFENSSPAMESVLGDLIKTTIDNYEPRARVIEVNVTSDPDSHFVYATILFSVINKEEPLALELILNRIR